MTKNIRVLVPLAQGCEELEAVTIIDILRRANIEVITASLSDAPVQCARQTVIIADSTLDSVLNDDFDLLVLPGGLPGADNLNADQRIHTLINRLNSKGKYIAAICASPKVLVTNGILNGKNTTAYPGSLEQIDMSKVQLSNTKIEIAGNVITSRGPGTAMDFSLKLIEVLLGDEARKQVEDPLVR